MPPRKRARVSQAATPDVQVEATSPNASLTNDEDILNDPWTDEEETALFKGLIKWKPTGIHKHFRMIQLHEFLLENHYIHPRAEHTKIPGIWKKLATLYDLDSLDQREDARQLSDLSDDEDEEEDRENIEDAYSVAANKIHKTSFFLPEEDFNEEIWNARLADDKAQRDESPLSLPELNLAAEPPVRFTPAFSIEPEDNAAPAAKRRGRPPGTGNKTRTAGRPSMRSRRTTESVAQEEEDEKSDEEQDDEESEQEDEEEEEDEGEEEEQEVSTTRKGRSQGRSTNRGRPRKRGKG